MVHRGSTRRGHFEADLALHFFGWDHPGSLVAGSGGRCASAVQLMYAERPLEVITKALEMLPAALAEEKPKKRRRKK